MQEKVLNAIKFRFMREPVKDKGRLEHIISAINNVLEYTNGISHDEMLANKILCHAVAYNVQIVGEAVYRLSTEFKENHNEIPWRDVVGMRHILVHDYYTVDLEVLWNVVQEDLPPFKQLIETYLSEFEKEKD